MAKRSQRIKKVVIPVAGMGTRFLPATKSLPKEMLPVVDRPIIHYIVEEAINAGLETVIFITSRPKISIEDYFDPRDLTAFKLAQIGKTHLIEDVLNLANKLEIISVRQYEPKGLGHAVLQAAPIVRGEPFAVVLGDDIIRAKANGLSAIGQCVERFNELERGSVIGTIQVPREDTKLYGVVELDEKGSEKERITRFVEKPDPADAPSTWAMPGRYVFEPEIIDFLAKTPPGKNGEIQLTDAMQAMLAVHPYYAQKIEGDRYDTGDKLGYIIANVAVALEDDALKEKLREWLGKKLGK